MANRFTSALSTLWQAFKPTVSILSSKLGTSLLQIAKEGFAEAYANDNLKTDADRRAYVFSKLRASDLSTNNALADTAIYLIIAEAEKRYVHGS